MVWSFLKSLVKRSPPFRERVEQLIAADDAKELAQFLSSRREEGKTLLRTFEAELKEAPTPANRDALVPRMTALIAIYSKVFHDPEPLSWFQQAPATQPTENTELVRRMEAARSAFSKGEFEAADDEARHGLDELSDRDDPEAETNPETIALKSSLLAVRGGVAVRQEQFDDASDFFRESLRWARAGAPTDTLLGALLNLIDLHTRKKTFEGADTYIQEAIPLAENTSYPDVLGKLLVERGIEQTRLGKLDDSIRTFDQAHQVRPQWPYPLYQRGWAHYIGGDPVAALDDYRACAERAPIFFTVQREIRSLEKVADGTLPIDVYQSFCAVRGEVQRDAEKVRTVSRQLLTRASDFAPAYLLAAEAELALGDADAARELARESRKHDPDDDTAAAALFLEWTLAHRSQEPEAAKNAFEALRQSYPGQPATRILERMQENNGQAMRVRWTFALDGSLYLDGGEPTAPAGPGDPSPSPHA